MKSRPSVGKNTHSEDPVPKEETPVGGLRVSALATWLLVICRVLVYCLTGFTGMREDGDLSCGGLVAYGEQEQKSSYTVPSATRPAKAFETSRSTNTETLQLNHQNVQRMRPAVGVKSACSPVGEVHVHLLTQEPAFECSVDGAHAQGGCVPLPSTRIRGHEAKRVSDQCLANTGARNLKCLKMEDWASGTLIRPTNSYYIYYLSPFSLTRTGTG
ncbi:hypothetical protein F4810DRAFT_647330 [Camillea tinctor]|nr:hypothetical protein F4810DRAFT_647330 [Camillea tinctor]